MGLSEYMINEEAFDYSSFIELLYKNESKGYVSLFRKGFTGIFKKLKRKMIYLKVLRISLILNLILIYICL